MSNEKIAAALEVMPLNRATNSSQYIPPSTSDLKSLPEAQNIEWEDRFFEGENDVVAVYDFDYALMEDFNTKLSYIPFLIPPLYPFLVLGCHPCFLWKRVQWEVNSQHVCITRDGIRFVKDKRKSLCGLPCSDAGKVSKTVPFDKITDCDVTEPAGATCCCIKNVLTTIHVDTASSGGPNSDGVVRHELTLKGLKDPYGFKQLVWAMKRSNGYTYHATVSAQQGGDGRVSPLVQSTMADRLPLLMTEIRDELREQTKLMKEGVTKK